MYGRHFDLEDELVSHISRKSIDLLKANYRVSLLLSPFLFFIEKLDSTACNFIRLDIWEELHNIFQICVSNGYKVGHNVCLINWIIITIIFVLTNGMIILYRMICPRMSGDSWWNWRISSRYSEVNIINSSGLRLFKQLVRIRCHWVNMSKIQRKRGRKEGCSLEMTPVPSLWKRVIANSHLGWEGMRNGITQLFFLNEKSHQPINASVLSSYGIIEYLSFVVIIYRDFFLYEISDCEIVNLRGLIKICNYMFDILL